MTSLEAHHRRTNVLVLSDAPLVTWCIQLSLLSLTGLAASIRAPSVEALQESLTAGPPEVLVAAPGSACPQFCRALRACHSAPRPPTVLCLPARACPQTSCGVHLVLPLPQADPAVLRLALRRALERTQYHRQAQPRSEVGKRPSGRSQSPEPGRESLGGPPLALVEHSGLSNREREVGLLVMEGCSSQEIAARLFISQRTVEKHRANLMAKLGVSNAAALTRELLYLCWMEPAAA